MAEPGERLGQSILAAAFPAKEDQSSLKQDSQVQGKTAMRHIPQVKSQLLRIGESGVPTDLSPAGQSRADSAAYLTANSEFLYRIGKKRTRTDKAAVSCQNRQELRGIMESQSAQRSTSVRKRADARSRRSATPFAAPTSWAW